MMERLLFAKARWAVEREPVDVERSVEIEMARLCETLRPGLRVAVTVGSRGIKDIPLILRSVVSFLSSRGARPFLLSAMGSHGGGTPLGQRHILQGLGIREESLQVPIVVTGEALLLGQTEEGYRLFMDRQALEADAVLLVNRIKPHTSFQGRIGSGLLKMLVVGLGKEAGAREVHRVGPQKMEEAIISLSRLALERLNVLGGLAIIEDCYGTLKIESVSAEALLEREIQLFELSKAVSPRLPLQRCDLLIVLEMGKEISGTGLDPNVIGRFRIDGQKEPDMPRIERVVVLRPSPHFDGNANGIGLADFTTKQVVEAIDWQKTLTNVLSTGYLRRAFCPPFLPTEKEAVEFALASLEKEPCEVSAVIVKNTTQLDTFWLSETAFLAAEGVRRVGPFEALRFDPSGRLVIRE